MNNTIPHDICQEMIDLAATALSLDPTALEECIGLLHEHNPVDVLSAAEGLGTHDVGTLRAHLEGDKAIDAWLENFDEVG